MDVCQMANELLNFENDSVFFQKSLDNLRKDYSNKFIAIKNGKIISKASSIEEINKDLNEKGIDPSKTVIEFVSEEETIMVL